MTNRNAIEGFINRRQLLEDELTQFIELYEGTQVHIIMALAEKIKHMCFHIGSPSSVPNMLESIVNGKVKMWSTRWENAGEKINTCVHSRRIDKLEDDSFIKGHFRWNWKGYMLNRETRDYIKSFYIDNEISKLETAKRESENKLRFKINSFVCIMNEMGECATIEVEVLNKAFTNSYRYVYYFKRDEVSTDCNLKIPITEYEKMWVKKILFDKFPDLHKLSR